MPDITRKEVHHLRVQFTEEEIRKFSADLARATVKLAEVEENKKVANAQFADGKARLSTEMSQLARRIQNGYEMRLVECRVDLDRPVRGTATIVRIDTGEIIQQRAMTETERQQVLKFDRDKVTGPQPPEAA